MTPRGECNASRLLPASPNRCHWTRGRRVFTICQSRDAIRPTYIPTALGAVPDCFLPLPLPLPLPAFVQLKSWPGQATLRVVPSLTRYFEPAPSCRAQFLAPAKTFSPQTPCLSARPSLPPAWHPLKTSSAHLRRHPTKMLATLSDQTTHVALS
jgi:hypothetical protein